MLRLILCLISGKKKIPIVSKTYYVCCIDFPWRQSSYFGNDLLDKHLVIQAASIIFYLYLLIFLLRFSPWELLVGQEKKSILSL